MFHRNPSQLSPCLVRRFRKRPGFATSAVWKSRTHGSGVPRWFFKRYRGPGPPRASINPLINWHTVEATMSLDLLDAWSIFWLPGSTWWVWCFPKTQKENTERKHKTFGAEGGTLQECGLLGTVENATIPDDRSDMVRPPAPLRLQIG